MACATGPRAALGPCPSPIRDGWRFDFDASLARYVRCWSEWYAACRCSNAILNSKRKVPNIGSSARAQLRTCAAAREAVQDKLVDGSSLGACALLVEERLGALESQRVDKGRGRPSLGQ